MSTELFSRDTRETDLAQLVGRRLLLPATGEPNAGLASHGTVHRYLAAALAATGPDEANQWLALREQLAMRALAGCNPARARIIRYRSHEWSNELLAQAESDQDEDLAMLAEAFCIDARIMLGDLDDQELPAGQHRLPELLHAVYRLGGWPCGWRGTLESGQLQIYRRRATD